MKRRLALVTLVVSDYDVAIAFYCDALGFELIEDLPQDGKRWVVVAPQGQVSSALLLARAVNDAQRAAIGNQTGGRVAFFLETDDFTRDHQAMIKAGVNFEEAPRVEPYGIVAVFSDPFGNRWDLLERRED